MEAIQKVISHYQDSNTINLDNLQITDLAPLLPELAKLPKLQNLSLSSNKLPSLPPDLSALKVLHTLSIKDNPFTSLELTVESLKSLPNLKSLDINLTTNDEAQLVLTSLSKLETLNGETIDLASDEEEIDLVKMIANDENSHPKSLSKGPPALDDLTEAAKVYDFIRVIRKSEKPEDDKELGSIFEAQMASVVGELRKSLSEASPEHVKGGMILKAKYSLLDKAFNKMIDMYPTNKNVATVWRQINKLYGEMFDGFMTLLIEAVPQEPDPELVQNSVKEATEKLQQEVEELRGEMSVLEGRLKSEQDEKDRIIGDRKELAMQVNSLEEENKKYLQTIIKRSKEVAITASPSVPLLPPSSQSPKAQSVSPQHVQPFSPVNKRSPPQETRRILSLKALKEVINDIYTQKVKFDERCAMAGQPKETMEQYMYTYLNQRYGLKALIIEWATAIVSGIKKHSKEDSDVALFGKILQNECDEEYRLIHIEVKTAIIDILKAKMRKKYPLKSDASILKILSDVQSGYIEEWACDAIVKKMYNEEDAMLLLGRIKERVAATGKDSNRILFIEFQRMVLNFQLLKHEKYLRKFIGLFKKVDRDTNGIIDDIEFKILLQRMNISRIDTEADRLLQKIDPKHNRQITFSECVTFFTSEMIDGASGGKTESIIDALNSEEAVLTVSGSPEVPSINQGLSQ